VHKFSKSVKKFAALVGAASVFVTLPVLAQTKPAPEMQTKPEADMQTAPETDMQTAPQVERKPMTPSSSPAMNSTTTRRSVVDVAASSDSFKTLTAALKAAGLDKTLASGGPYTIFAPTDEAFAALPKGTVEQLLMPQNKDLLIKVLTYHVVPGDNASSTLTTGETKTLEGASVKVDVSSSGAVMVNDAKVVQPDIQASNGVIHVINKVIMPPAPDASSSTPSK
jgi:uncharacterized surface protein with fasciclin (FAS1) repeats